MTKFILHGGATRKMVENNKKFFQETVAGFNGKVKVLAVYFSRDEKEWPELFSDDQKNFQSDSFKKTIEIEMALLDISALEEQIKKTDIIYVRGGDTQLLLKRLKAMPNFSELIKNKVYAGSSAGAYLVSEYYYSNSKDKIEEGLGILPIKVFAHWSESQQEALNRLKSTGEDLPIYKIPETEFVIINK